MRGDTKRLRGDTKRLRGDTKRLRGDTKRLRGDTKRLRGDTKRLRGVTKRLFSSQKLKFAAILASFIYTRLLIKKKDGKFSVSTKLFFHPHQSFLNDRSHQFPIFRKEITARKTPCIRGTRTV